jgi:hypothetical protein
MEKFYPSAPSEAESGAKRGCIVLSHASETGDRLKTLDALKQTG